MQKMTYNPNIHHRKSIRFKGYDYAQTGLYFITICTHNRKCLFGDIKNGKMILNNAGQMANQCWLEIPDHFPNVQLHAHIIMPNHTHGIIEIVGANNHSPTNMNNHSPTNTDDHSPNITNNHSPNITNNHSPTNTNNHSPTNTNNHSPTKTHNMKGAKIVSPLRSPSKTIGSMVRGYKIGVTKWFRSTMPNKFPGGQPVWQRNFWEHIIKNDIEYARIAQYIIDNPQKWENDKLNNGDGHVIL